MIFATLLASALALIGAPLAQAASYTYANNVSTAENVQRSSGVRASIKGGTATLESFSADGAGTHLYVETFYPAPGYQTVGLARGGSYTNLTHGDVANAQQKCHWDWPWSAGNIGSLKMTCKTK